MERIPLTLKDYRNIGKTLKIQWIGKTKPRNNKDKTLWLDSNGRIWRVAYYTIRISVLRKKRKRSFFHSVTEQDYNDLAKKKHIGFLGPIPNRTDIKTNWICPNGHHYKTKYSTIKNSKLTGCLKCGRASQARKVSGENHCRWRGGSPKYGPDWNPGIKRIIRTRDNYTCQRCGIQTKFGTKKVHVHHIIPAKYSYEKRNDIPNFICLCPKCNIWADNHLDKSIPTFRNHLHKKHCYTYHDNPRTIISKKTKLVSL